MDIMATKTSTRAFQLKGSLFTLTVMQMLKADIAALSTQLGALAKQTPDLFNHMPVVIDLSKLSDEDQDFDFVTTQTLLRKHGLIPVGVRSGTPSLHKEAIASGLPVMPTSKQEVAEEKENSADKTSEKLVTQSLHHNTKLITQPVRSGQRIYAKGGDLVILATVSPGAELLADGHIHIYGALRGRALAGLSGDQDARIFCQTLEAELVSIAGHYWVNEDLKIPQGGQGVQIYLENERLHIGSF